MVTFEQVVKAYQEYEEKIDTVSFFFRRQDACPRYYELLNDANVAFDTYRELIAIYEYENGGNLT